MTRLLVLVFMAVPALAHAEHETAEPPVAIAPHATVGVEVLGGDATTAGGRAHLGLSTAFGTGRVRPQLGLGITWGWSTLSVSDPRALDGSVSLGHVDYGPEAQLGLRFADGGLVDTRVFASLAYLRTDLDDRLEMDPVPGVEGRTGLRASIGANWADRAARAATSRRHRDSDKDGMFDWMILLLPQQAEVAWQRSAGSDRVGISLGWGI